VGGERSWRFAFGDASESFIDRQLLVQELSDRIIRTSHAIGIGRTDHLQQNLAHSSCFEGLGFGLRLGSLRPFTRPVLLGQETVRWNAGARRELKLNAAVQLPAADIQGPYTRVVDFQLLDITETIRRVINEGSLSFLSTECPETVDNSHII